MVNDRLFKLKKKVDEARSAVSTCMLLLLLVSFSHGLNDLFKEGWKHDDFFWVHVGVFAIQTLSWAALGVALSIQTDSIIKVLTEVNAAVANDSSKRSNL